MAHLRNGPLPELSERELASVEADGAYLGLESVRSEAAIVRLHRKANGGSSDDIASFVLVEALIEKGRYASALDVFMENLTRYPYSPSIDLLRMRVLKGDAVAAELLLCAGRFNDTGKLSQMQELTSETPLGKMARAAVALHELSESPGASPRYASFDSCPREAQAGASGELACAEMDLAQRLDATDALRDAAQALVTSGYAWSILARALLEAQALRDLVTQLHSLPDQVHVHASPIFCLGTSGADLLEDGLIALERAIECGAKNGPVEAYMELYRGQSALAPAAVDKLLRYKSELLYYQEHRLAHQPTNEAYHLINDVRHLSLWDEERAKESNRQLVASAKSEIHAKISTPSYTGPTPPAIPGSLG